MCTSWSGICTEENAMRMESECWERVRFDRSGVTRVDLGSAPEEGNSGLLILGQMDKSR